jgi:hypothetical protein
MEVFYQEIVTVNGKDFVLHTCDYSETVNEWIADGLVDAESSDQCIFDLVCDDLEASPVG